jgi:hypothetical protein
MGRHIRCPRFLYHVLRVKGLGGRGPGMIDRCAWFRTCSIVVILRSISCSGGWVNAHSMVEVTRNEHTRTW